MVVGGGGRVFMPLMNPRPRTLQPSYNVTITRKARVNLTAAADVSGSTLSVPRPPPEILIGGRDADPLIDPLFMPTSVAVVRAPATTSATTASSSLGTEYSEHSEYSELLVATNSKIYKYPLPIEGSWQQVRPIVVRESASRIRGLVVVPVPSPAPGDGGADSRSVH